MLEPTPKAWRRDVLSKFNSLSKVAAYSGSCSFFVALSVDECLTGHPERCPAGSNSSLMTWGSLLTTLWAPQYLLRLLRREATNVSTIKAPKIWNAQTVFYLLHWASTAWESPTFVTLQETQKPPFSPTSNSELSDQNITQPWGPPS